MPAIETHISQEEADEFALGACDGDTAREIALHIIECPACEERVNAAEDLTSHLALTAPRQRPDPRLRERLLVDAGIVRPALLSRLIRITGVTATVAALAVAALAFGGYLALRGDVDRLSQANARMADDLRALQSQEIEIAVLSEELETTSDTVEALQTQANQDKQLQLALLSPSSREAHVYAVETDAESIGRFVWDPDQGRIWFFATKLPPLAAGETYELFARVTDGSYVSLGTFNADPEGFARFEAEVPDGLDVYDSAVVTIERQWTPGERERSGATVFVLDLSTFEQ